MPPVLGLLLVGLATVVVILSVQLIWLRRSVRRQTVRARGESAALRRTVEEFARAQEEERRAVARELHDQVGQLLTAISLELNQVECVRTSSKEAFAAKVEDIRVLIRQAGNSVRDLAMGLRPSVLDDFGLGPAVEWQAREFARRSGISVDVAINGSVEELPEPHRTCIYRVVQEALTNCARHSRAHHIRVGLRRLADFVTLTVHDDGSGFRLHDKARSGFGLRSIEERARQLGGTVSIRSQPASGTLLRLELPLLRGARS